MVAKYTRRQKKGAYQPDRRLLIGAGLVAVLGVLGSLGVWATRVPVADAAGCYAEAPERATVVLFDASIYRERDEQMRSIRLYLEGLWDGLAFNERLSLFTTEEALLGSVMRPRLVLCGQAQGSAALAAIGAGNPSAGYLTAQKRRAFERQFAPELDVILARRPGSGHDQGAQSPILEVVAQLSRRPELSRGGRLVLISDLINNSDTATFCSVHNDMPPFAAFRKRPTYQRVAPAPLDGITVEVAMVLLPGYGEGALAHCRSEEEIRAFWEAYFRENGAAEVSFTRIRFGHTRQG